MAIRLAVRSVVRRRIAPKRVKHDELGATSGDLQAIEALRKKQVARSKKKTTKRRKR